MSSVPYPMAPPADYDDDTQEHFHGPKDPEILAKHRAARQPDVITTRRIRTIDVEKVVAKSVPPKHEEDEESP